MLLSVVSLLVSVIVPVSDVPSRVDVDRFPILLAAHRNMNVLQPRRRVDFSRMT